MNELTSLSESLTRLGLSNMPGKAESSIIEPWFPPYAYLQTADQRVSDHYRSGHQFESEALTDSHSRNDPQYARRSTSQALQDIIEFNVKRDEERILCLEKKNKRLRNKLNRLEKGLNFDPEYLGMVNSLKFENQKLTDRISKDQDKIKDLESLLSECQTKVFKLQPQEDITDEHIARAYAGLSQQIAQWAIQTLDAIDEAVESNRVSSSSLFKRISDDAGYFWARQQASKEFYLRHCVFGVLQAGILTNDRHIFGTGDEMRQFINHVEAMDSQDAESRNRWLGELVMYLKTRSEIAEPPKKAIDAIIDLINNALRPDVPFDLIGEHEQATTLREIVLKAIILATTYKSCSNRYHLLPQISEWTLSPKKIAAGYELKNFEVRDAKTGRIVGPNKVFDGIVSLIEPGLYNMDKRGGLCLHKGIYLVDLQHPLLSNGETESKTEPKSTENIEEPAKKKIKAEWEESQVDF